MKRPSVEACRVKKGLKLPWEGAVLPRGEWDERENRAFPGRVPYIRTRKKRNKRT